MQRDARARELTQVELATLRDLLGSEDVRLEGEEVVHGAQRWPIVEGVVVMLEPERWSPHVRSRLGACAREGRSADFAPDVQLTFGEEWLAYGEILPEHEAEFGRYFDLVDLDALRNLRVVDLGCGIGRWSWFLRDRCRQLVLVDFSDAIFVARRNLSQVPGATFIQADVTQLPFRHDAFGFAFSLGVLHHLPIDALGAVRRLAPLAPELLVFLYYALDNKPAHFRALLRIVTLARLALCRIRSRAVRKAVSWLGARFLYLPLVLLGRALRPLGLERHVPLAEFYGDRSLQRIEQDVYDRFFTRIEQRVTREQILTLRDTFSEVVASERLPYWHFLCRR